MFNRRVKEIRHSSAGFTIIELMIAISVLATILLLVSVGIIQISKTYYKGITQANTQQKAREIMDTVTQSIQFGNFTTVSSASASLSGFSTQAYCIDQERFTFVSGVQKRESLPSDATATPAHIRHALWQDDAPVGTCTAVNLSPITPVSVKGHELIGDKMRVTKFEIVHKKTVSLDCTLDLYCVSITLMYGDDDLIDEKTNPDSSNWQCKPSAGIFSGAFCAKAQLTAVVGKRLRGN